MRVRGERRDDQISRRGGVSGAGRGCDKIRFPGKSEDAAG